MKNTAYSQKEYEQMILLYQNGESMAKVAKHFGCSPATVQNTLNRNNIITRNLSEARRNFLEYTLDENYFKNINSSEKAYWLGVMYTDGYVMECQYTNKFGIAVKASDSSWLELFAKDLKTNTQVKIYTTTKDSEYTKQGYQYARLIIGNNKIVQDLIELGVVFHKTSIISCLPKIDNLYMIDFIRGVVDGDGSLRKDYPAITISGNYSFLKEIGNYLKLPYNIYKDKTIYGLHFSNGYNTNIYLEKLLYKDATRYLERKYNIAKRSFNSPLTLEDVMEKSE